MHSTFTHSTHKMAGDMYLENLDEFIFDEDRVVTYRWLSQTLSVHVNQAKRMLETYVEHREKKANPAAINVTYLLSGTQEADNGVRLNKVVVVSDKDLEKTEAGMAEVLSKHVYSIQKAALRDSNTLYMTDYQVIKDNIKQPNRFSAIKCAEAKPRTPGELDELDERSGASHSPAATPSKPKINGSAERHVVESLKPEPKKSTASRGQKGQITSFGGFAASSGRGSSGKSEGTEQVDSNRPKKEEQRRTHQGSKAKGSMMAFLNRPSAAQPKAEETASPPRQPRTTAPQAQGPPRPSKDQGSLPEARRDTKQGPPRPSKDQGSLPEARRDTKQGGKAKRKAAKIDVSDSDSEEERQTTKRRRRIVQPDSSSSSEDDVSDMEDSPIPPTPPPAPVDLNASDEEEEVTTRSSHMPSREEPDVTTSSSGKRRRRKRVLKNKTTIDDEGCMVTEKVWESDWTDDDEVEAPTSKKTTPHGPSLSAGGGAKTVEEEEEGKKKKTSPGSGSGKPKQRSLMSFFKKK